MSAFLGLIALILFATANPITSQAINMTVSGRLCCTSTGNCPGQGVGGVDVYLNCSSGSGAFVRVGQGRTNDFITNRYGYFFISANPQEVPFNLTAGLPLPSCITQVELPLNRTVCPALSTVNRTLVGLTGVRGVVRDELGRILRVNATVVGFVNGGI